mmetsp:Transcript_28215/g.65237  ORF Transcript_28215/g.65237 Transcript_28215/m.65237 type:complete len:194 (+) Transcript_28215:62-643(+)
MAVRVYVNALLWLSWGCLAHAGQIHQAARSNDVSQLLKLGESTLAAGLNQQESGSGQTPLMAATLTGAEKSVEFLLQRGADASIPEKDGYTPFHGAGFQGRAAVAKLLLAHGLDPSDRHKDGFTPLHRACWGRERRHTEMVRFLLDNGVRVEEPATSGKTCSDMTQYKPTKELIDQRLKQKTPKPGKGATQDL